ncbi:brassinosteroid-responsive RING protein 1-like [Juglans microcarpa x Juglans regia]|uniref:brassinosteroid-responsive RING protein 1-like n=1 Tax=Juglans microcarpa x Juglans regia TaxID=2249226 RepID=UPI001B7E9065|nr:brassinosteroid-responsive RING protein 1-like [Juglans microcarpa x Juglans regia]
MGFPVGYTDVIFPNLFLHGLSLLGFIRSLIFSLFRFLGLLDILETDATWPEDATRMPEHKPVSELLIQEFLPVMKFQDHADCAEVGDPPESCAVCLYEFEGGEEIRWLRNCRHIFHRACMDRWMEHEQRTCPLCRTLFVPDHEMKSEFNQRLWAASGIPDLYSEYSEQSSFSGFLLYG